jgi:hypothetical protein
VQIVGYINTNKGLSFYCRFLLVGEWMGELMEDIQRYTDKRRDGQTKREREREVGR